MAGPVMPSPADWLTPDGKFTPALVQYLQELESIDSLSARIDRVFGSTRGSLLHRFASGWGLLEPGADGTVLQSNGPGEDLSFVELAAPYTSAVATIDDSSDAISITLGASGDYSFSASSAPSQSVHTRFLEVLTASIQADFAGQEFEVEYQGTVSAFVLAANPTGNMDYISIACHLDTDADAIDWGIVQRGPTTAIGSVNTNVPGYGPFKHTFVFTLPDTDAHILKFQIYPQNDGGTYQSGTLTLGRRRVIVRKKAA